MSADQHAEIMAALAALKADIRTLSERLDKSNGAIDHATAQIDKVANEVKPLISEFGPMLTRAASHPMLRMITGGK